MAPKSKIVPQAWVKLRTKLTKGVAKEWTLAKVQKVDRNGIILTWPHSRNNNDSTAVQWKKELVRWRDIESVRVRHEQRRTA